MAGLGEALNDDTSIMSDSTSVVSDGTSVMSDATAEIRMFLHFVPTGEENDSQHP